MMTIEMGAVAVWLFAGLTLVLVLAATAIATARR
jgi:hypothetical protein